jgi:hypothetical protein
MQCVLFDARAAWNHFHSGVTADVLATTADAFVDVGLKDAGYGSRALACILDIVAWASCLDCSLMLSLPACTYCPEWINTDDCWSELGRDNATGRIIPARNFGGTEASMKNLSAYIRSKGMKFGI